MVEQVLVMQVQADKGQQARKARHGAEEIVVVALRASLARACTRSARNKCTPRMCSGFFLPMRTARTCTALHQQCMPVPLLCCWRGAQVTVLQHQAQAQRHTQPGSGAGAGRRAPASGPAAGPAQPWAGKHAVAAKQPPAHGAQGDDTQHLASILRKQPTPVKSTGRTGHAGLGASGGVTLGAALGTARGPGSAGGLGPRVSKAAGARPSSAGGNVRSAAGSVATTPSRRKGSRAGQPASAAPELMGSGGSSSVAELMAEMGQLRAEIVRDQGRVEQLADKRAQGKC